MILRCLYNKSLVSKFGRVVFLNEDAPNTEVPAQAPSEGQKEERLALSADTAEGLVEIPESAPEVETESTINKKLVKDKNFLNSLWRTEWLFGTYLNTLKKDGTWKRLVEKYPDVDVKNPLKLIKAYAKKIALKEGRSVYTHNIDNPGNPWKYGFHIPYDSFADMLDEEFSTLNSAAKAAEARNLELEKKRVDPSYNVYSTNGLGYKFLDDGSFDDLKVLSDDNLYAKIHDVILSYAGDANKDEISAVLKFSEENFSSKSFFDVKVDRDSLFFVFSFSREGGKYQNYYLRLPRLAAFQNEKPFEDKVKGFVHQIVAAEKSYQKKVKSEDK